MAKVSPKADAEFSRALVLAMVVEGVFAAIGVLGIIITQKPLALIVPVVLGAIGFVVIFLPALKAWRARQSEQGGQASIVGDGGI